MREDYLYDKQTSAQAVIARPDLKLSEIRTFCEQNGLEFHGMGCPEGVGGTGWTDPTVFRAATHEYPARGVTIALDTVVEWTRALEGIGAKMLTGGVYRHYKGGIYTTVCEATEEADGQRVVVYKDKDGRAWTRPWNEFFMVVKGADGKLCGRFVFLYEFTSGEGQ
jgi:hypothetical protein